MDEHNTVILRAALPGALADERVRDTVRATARAIAERTGVTIHDLRADDSSLSVTLDGTDIVGVGFAAELRRLTNRWHEGKFGATLWGEPAP